MEVVTHKNEEQIAHLNSFKASLIDSEFFFYCLYPKPVQLLD